MKIINQDKIIKSFQILLKKNKIHHSLFFYGYSSVGKLTTSLFFIKSFFCKNRSSDFSSNNFSFCNQCNSCLEFNNFLHPGIILLSNGDRLPKITFLRTLLIQKKGNSKKIISEIIFELKHLIYRHKIRFLPKLKKRKALFPEGEIITDKENDSFFNQFYLNLEKTKEFDRDWLVSPKFLKDCSKLQNSLDRTYISKEGLEKILSYSKTQAKQKKWIVIENINQIHPSTVGLLLKTLEEPDPDVYFILISDEIKQVNQKIIFPLLSRCLKFKFNHLEENVEKVLKNRFDYTPKETYHLYQKSMNQYFSQFNQAQNEDAKLLTSLYLLNQPIYKTIDLYSKKKIDLTSIITLIKNSLEQHFKENLYKKDYKIQNSTKKIKIRYNDCLVLLKLIYRLEENLKTTRFNSQNLFLQLLSFLKSRKIIF